jgi:hypothetical protein
MFDAFAHYICITHIFKVYSNPIIGIAKFLVGCKCNYSWRIIIKITADVLLSYS